jgi:hypothetical protein
MNEYLLTLHLRSVREGSIDRTFLQGIRPSVGVFVVDYVVQWPTLQLGEAKPRKPLCASICKDASLFIVHDEYGHRRIVHDGLISTGRVIQER